LLIGLRLNKVGGGGGQVRANQGIGLLAEVDFVLIQEVLAAGDLVERVAIEDPLGAEGREGAGDLGYGGADVGVVLQGGVQVLESGKDAAGGVLKHLAAGNVGLNGIAIRGLNRCDVGIPVVGDNTGGGIQGKGLRADSGPTKQISALIGGVGQANDLGLNALHFLGDSLSVGVIESAVGTLGAERKGPGKSSDDVAEGGIGDLETRLESGDVLEVLIVLAGLVVVQDDVGGGSGIVGELVNPSAAGNLLGSDVGVLFGLLNGSEQIGEWIGIESDRHSLCRRDHIDGDLHQLIDNASDLRRGLIGGLKTNQVGGFFIDVNAGDASLQVLKLLKNQAASLLVALRGGNGVADLKDDAGVGVQGSLAIGDGLILDVEEGVRVGVIAWTAGSRTTTRGNQRGIGDSDGKRTSGAGAARRRRYKNIAARIAIQIETLLVLSVDGIGKAGSQGIERSESCGDLLVADLDLSGELAARDFRSDVGALGEDVLKAGGGIGLGSKLKTLARDDEGSAGAGGESEAAIAGVDGGDVHEIGELIDELLALVDEGPGILSGSGGRGDLGVDGGDLRSEVVDLADGLGDGKVFAALDSAEIRGSLVESGGKILRGGQNRLARIGIAGIDGELGKTIEKSR